MIKRILLSVLILSSLGFALESIDCFQYYKYGYNPDLDEGGVKFEFFSPERIVYNAGDYVHVDYKIKNTFGIPIVHGNLKVLVLYRGIENVDRIEDDDIIDDFYVLDELYLFENDTYSGSFKWKIPENAKEGVYVFNAYFMEKKKFNIAGLNFHTSIPGATTSFEIRNSGIQRQILFDKNETYINDERYLFRSFIPVFEPGTPVTIKARLNSLNFQGDVELKKELYYWDDANPLNLISESNEIINARGLDSILYDLGILRPSVYVAKFTAKSGEMKSILKVRFTIRGGVGRIIHIGLDRFPMYASDNITAFFCVSNSAAHPGDNVSFIGYGKLRVEDFEGNVILDESFAKEEITPQIIGKATTFKPEKTYSRLKVIGELYDESNVLHDKEEMIYDFSKFEQIEKGMTKRYLEARNKTLYYSVEYHDEFGNTIDGNCIIYIVDQNGRVVRTIKRNCNNLSGEIRLDGLKTGAYIFKVLDANSKVKIERVVTIEEVGLPWSLVISIVLVLLVILSAIKLVKK